jgi:hypothetical protein
MRTVVILAVCIAEGCHSHAAWICAKLGGVPPSLRCDLRASSAWCHIAASLLQSTIGSLSKDESGRSETGGDEYKLEADVGYLLDSAYARIQPRHIGS